MVDYEKLYHLMVDAAENAIGAINAQNYGEARSILIHAEREAEERYIETADQEDRAMQLRDTHVTKSKP